MANNYHLTKKGNDWRLKKEGSSRATKVFDTKEEGLDFSIDFMNDNGGSLKIHKSNGQIQEERTYPRKNDPKTTEG